MKKILTVVLLLVSSLARPQATTWAMPDQPGEPVQAEFLNSGAAAFVWGNHAAFENEGGWSYRSYSVAGAESVRLNDISTNPGTVYAVGAFVVGGYPRPLVLRLDAGFDADSAIAPAAGGFYGTGELTAAGGGFDVRAWGSRNYQGFPDTATTQRAFNVQVPLQWGQLTQLVQEVHPRNTSVKHAMGDYAVGSFPGDFAFMWANSLETDSLHIQGHVGSLEDVSTDLTMCGSVQVDGVIQCGIVIQPAQNGGVYSTYGLIGHSIEFHSGHDGYLVGSYDGRPAILMQSNGSLWTLSQPGRCLRVRRPGGVLAVASLVGGSTLRVDRFTAGFPGECWVQEGFVPTQAVPFGPAFTFGLPDASGLAYPRSYSAVESSEAAGSEGCSTGTPEQFARSASPIRELLSPDGRLVARASLPAADGLYIVRRADGSARLEYLRTNR